MLKPREQWRKGMSYEDLIAEMDSQLRFPGLSNSWTMPVENRLDMELTGIKTPVGLKVQGPDIGEIQRIGSTIEEILAPVENTRAVFAERVSQGFHINITVDRQSAARYGLTVNDVQMAISSGNRRRQDRFHGAGTRTISDQRPLPAGLPQRPGRTQGRADHDANRSTNTSG
jgi:copper/silver efflux system protein